jgi:FkbM family methyltransferase
VNVFIDLGSHFGAITRKFIASKLYSPDFVLHAFECNPVISPAIFKAYPPFVNVHREAAWIFDGKLEFYVNKDQRVQGASFCKEKTTGNLDKEHPVTVDCIDFCEWLKRNFQLNDNIIVKSNIEGAEYALFNKMLANGTIQYIKRLFLMRHWHKIGLPEEVDTKLISDLRAVPNLVVDLAYSF